jgi:hypothetical protein
MTEIAFSRGRDIHDNRPQRLGAPNFVAFVAALDADRAPTKAGAAYVSGPFNGDGRRCADGAEPVRFLAVDIDRIAPDVLSDLRLWLARFSGCAWPTHSSKPDAPRERVIVELDRDATRAECLAIGRTLAADLEQEFGDAIEVDPSTFKPEQPAFVPPTGAKLARFEGEPLDVDQYVRDAPSGAHASSAGAATGAEDADLIAAIADGSRYHESLTSLAARYVGRGMPEPDVVAALRGLMDEHKPEGDVERWISRHAEIPRIVASAVKKFARPAKPATASDDAPPAQLPPLDIFREFVAPTLGAEDFPSILAEFAILQARAAGHDPSAYLIACLGASSGAIGDDVRIKLDSRTSWFESARLWLLLLGKPGTAKTPAIRAAMAPLYALHRRLRGEYNRAIEGLADDAPKPPMPAVFVNDATIEKLSEILADNPRGVIAVFEELDTWIGSHDCYRAGQGSKDRGEWLRLFDGGPHQVDRIKRGSFFVPNWGASILGATTPAGLRRHAKNLPADGLIQRLLPVMVRPPSAPDHTILGASVRQSRFAFETRLLELHDLLDGTVRLSADAAEIFTARRNELRDEVEAVASLSEPFAAHLSKHAALLGRLALTMHCLEHGPDALAVAVSGETMTRARRLLHKLMRHSLATFDMLGGNNTALTLARSLALSIIAAGLKTATKNSLLQACRPFRNADQREQWDAIGALEDSGWLLPVEDGRRYGGRPTGWAVHPEVHSLFAERAELHRQHRRRVIGTIKGSDDES